MPPEKFLTYDCPAKVNLALSVAPPLEPGGLHPLASWMVAVDYTDTLTMAAIDDEPSRFDLAFEAGIQGSTQLSWPIESDLAYRAHALLERHIGHTLPVHLTLRKRIPTGAGLGGGSSDAAFVLVGLNKLFRLGVDEDELKTLAYQLGSDVAFLVGVAMGQPSAIVTGTGEAIEQAPLQHPIDLTLIFPEIACPTGGVYAAFDRLAVDAKPQTAPDIARVRALTRQATLCADDPFNDLAEAALTVRPQLRRTIDRVREVTHTPIHVTGSGSTLFVVGGSKAESGDIARAVKKIGVRAVAVRSIQAACR